MSIQGQPQLSETAFGPQERGKGLLRRAEKRHTLAYVLSGL